MAESQTTFDYLIIGGGTAGLLLASLLAESSHTIAVIESGSDLSKDDEILIPGLSYKNNGAPGKSFPYLTTPQSGLASRPIYVGRGKAVGGSSTTNTMVLGRAHKEEYDAFAKLIGEGSSWGWEEWLGGFLKSETYIGEDGQPGANTGFNGSSGPIKRVLPLRKCETLHDTFIKASVELGAEWIPDPAQGNNAGVSPSFCAVDPAKGTRSSALTEIFPSLKDKDNVTILTESHVSRILFSEGPGDVVATGVEYLDEIGNNQTLVAKKEVILAAGSYNSPQLLELSGIGSPEVLSKFSIKPIVSLPTVGEGLQDHTWTWMVTEIDTSIESMDALGEPGRAEAEFAEYATKKTGMLTQIPTSTLSFLPSRVFLSESQIESIVSRLTAKFDATGDKFLKIYADWVKESRVPIMEVACAPAYIPLVPQPAVPGKRYCSFAVALCHPLTRGSVHITSTDPLAAPEIDSKLLAEEIDAELIIAGVEHTRKIIASDAYKNVITHTLYPPSEDNDLDTYIRNNSMTLWHPVSTAQLRPREEGGVVDVDLRVYGTKNLRIVDASVFPIQISAHPLATVYALAVLAAQRILKDA